MKKKKEDEKRKKKKILQEMNWATAQIVLQDKGVNRDLVRLKGRSGC